MGLARDVEIDVLDSSGKGLATLKDREQADTQEGAEDPDDAHRDPAGKEGLAEDVARAIKRHGPEDQECQRLRDGFCQRKFICV